MYSPQNAAAQPNNAQKRQSGEVQNKSGGGGPPAASSGGFLKNQITFERLLKIKLSPFERYYLRNDYMFVLEK